MIEPPRLCAAAHASAPASNSQSTGCPGTDFDIEASIHPRRGPVRTLRSGYPGVRTAVTRKRGLYQFSGSGRTRAARLGGRLAHQMRLGSDCARNGADPYQYDQRRESRAMTGAASKSNRRPRRARTILHNADYGQTVLVAAPAKTRDCPLGLQRGGYLSLPFMFVSAPMSVPTRSAAASMSRSARDAYLSIMLALE